jgi:Arc/MetJ-type ribon-helix-helix transcriptional regulator
MQEALRLLEESERLELVKLSALRRDIQAGLDSGEPVLFLTKKPFVSLPRIVKRHGFFRNFFAQPLRSEA